MKKSYTIPIEQNKIDQLYNLWLNNGYETKEDIDIVENHLLGFEKDISEIKLYTFENPSSSSIESSCITIYNKNLPIMESDVVAFTSRCETRKCPHFIDTVDSLAYTNPKDLWWWTHNLGYKFEKTRVVQFRYSTLDKFFKSKRWGISHSSFVNEPFGYSIFQAIDYGKIPILNRDWCKDIEYPFRSYSKSQFEKQVKTIKGVSYQERNDILENLRTKLNNLYNNPIIWANQYLSIYNGKD